MKAFSEGVGRSLEWKQPASRKQLYELLAGRDVVANMVFRSSAGTLATIETAHGSRTFKRVGFLDARVTGRRAGSEKNTAVFTPSFWGAGTLAFADRETFLWKSLGFWRSEWAFCDSRLRNLVTFKRWPDKSRLKDIFKTHVLVEIDARAVSGARLPYLATLGFYLMLLSQQDTTLLAALSAAT